MTSLVLAAVNQLSQDPDLTALLGRSKSWPTWIFPERPVKVAVEGLSACMIVVNEFTQYTSANDHNTLLFPQLTVDVWADPTRPGKGEPPTVYDATDKIEAIAKIINRHFHLVDAGTPSGGIVIWGTAEEIAAKTGVVVTKSSLARGPEYSDVADSVGTKMGRLVYNVNRI